MKISRFTPCQYFEIHKPIYGGRKVGLNTRRIGVHNKVRITKRLKDGSLMYPVPFYVSGEQLRQYPIEPIPTCPDVKVRIIPIEDMETLEYV